MKLLRLALFGTFFAACLLFATPSTFATGGANAAVGQAASAACPTKSVLSSNDSSTAPICLTENTTLLTYVTDVLTRYRVLILSIMTLFAVVSGIQYMLSQGNAEAQKASKQRIYAMITGIVFFTLINLLASVLGGVK